MIVSDGTLRKAASSYWAPGTPFLPLNYVGRVDGIGTRAGDYMALYRSQLWVYVLVNKRATGVSRLPLKVLRRADDGSKADASNTPYGRLLANPNRLLSPNQFWRWVSSTYDLFGAAPVYKRRVGGIPVELIPLHPSALTRNDDATDDRPATWTYETTKVRLENIDDLDLVHFRTYEGVSPCEPLRASLEAEAAAVASTAAFWENGARPRFALSHPRTISEPVKEELARAWNAAAGGIGNTGGTVILEEGMKPEQLSMSADDAQYIETRKLHREECCAAFDVPPPAVHILDKATFSNITEQMRSLYRETHAPRLSEFEATLAKDLRSAPNPVTGEPDFAEDLYAEFLLDEVLRGDFEQRATAYAAADYMTIAEKRRKENLPHIDGTDRLFVNSAIIPLDEAGAVKTADARILPDDVRKIAGALSRGRSLDDLDPADLAGRLTNPDPILDALDQAVADHTPPALFLDRLKELTA